MSDSEIENFIAKQHGKEPTSNEAPPKSNLDSWGENQSVLETKESATTATIQPTFMNPFQQALLFIASIAGLLGLVMAIAGSNGAASSLSHSTIYSPADSSGLVVAAIGELLIVLSVAIFVGMLFYFMSKWDKINASK